MLYTISLKGDILLETENLVEALGFFEEKAIENEEVKMKAQKVILK